MSAAGPNDADLAAARGERVLAPQHEGFTGPMVSEVRSTLLGAALLTLREQGLEQRYFAQLHPSMHETLRTLPGSTWVPIGYAMEHYRACDAMRLAPDEMKAIGASVSLRTQRSFVATLGRAAASAGATPWHVVAQIPRVWGRIFQGGDHAAYRLGPKDVEIVTARCPLLEVPYFRVSLGAYYAAIAGLVARSVHWSPVKGAREAGAHAIRVSWA
jgi:hypothetical protein